MHGLIPAGLRLSRPGFEPLHSLLNTVKRVVDISDSSDSVKFGRLHPHAQSSRRRGGRGKMVAHWFIMESGEASACMHNGYGYERNSFSAVVGMLKFREL